jgi:hypothetical protein
MKFTEERTLKIQDNQFSWAEYRWDTGSNLWRYRRCSEGFFARYDLPSAFTEAERLLLTIKYSTQ